MAQQDRTTLQALIDLYITTNGNKEITGAQLNEILTNLNDSSFLQLNEIRTALSVSYQNVNDPSDWNGGIAPSTQNLVNDQLAERIKFIETNNASTKVAYVATTGDDIDYELGNPLKPLQTIQAALDAVGNDAKVIVAPGTYAGFTKASMSRVHVDIRGCVISGTIFITIGSDLVFNLEGATANNIRIDGGFVYGGFTSGYLEGSGTVFYRTKVERTAGVASSGNFSIYINCSIKSLSGGGVYRSYGSSYHNCYIEGVGGAAYQHTNQGYDKFYNCYLKSNTRTLSHEYNLFSAMMWNCRIESTGDNNLYYTFDSDQIYFKGCAFVTTANAPNINVVALNRTTAQQSTFEECRFITAGTAILDEGTYGGGDLGEFLFINCTINKAAITSVAPQKVVEHNTFVKLDLIDIN